MRKHNGPCTQFGNVVYMQPLSPLRYENNKPKSGAIIRDGDRKRGVHATPCVVPKKLFLEKNCATLHVISPSGYTQICVGLLPYMENGREIPVRFRQNYIIFKYFECETDNILLPCTCLSSSV